MLNKLLILIGLWLPLLALAAEKVSVNGAAIETEIKGTGEPILFFDAGTVSGLSGWDSIWDKLPGNSTAIRYARRGEGNSSKCAGELSAVDYAKDVESLLQALNIEQPVVYISHSYGGKVAREFAHRNPDKVLAMLFVDPINPRDVEIIEKLDPVNGVQSNQALRAEDTAQGKAFGWCFIQDIWDKSPAKGVAEIGDIPITLIAGVKKYPQPARLFDTDAARELWGQYQQQWVEQFPQGRAVMAFNSGHFVQDDEPELVISELEKLLKRASNTYRSSDNQLESGN